MPVGPPIVELTLLEPLLLFVPLVAAPPLAGVVPVVAPLAFFGIYDKCDS